MTRKLTALMAAVAIVAFAIPAVASAGTITSKAGTLAAVGTEITMTSTNSVTKTPFGEVKCGKVSLTTKLTKNTGGVFEAAGTGAGTTSECFLGETAVKITDETVPSIKSLVAGSGTASLTYIIDFPVITCHYSASAAPFTYVAGSDVISFTNVAIVGSPAPCTMGSYTGSFTTVIGGGLVPILD